MRLNTLAATAMVALFCLSSAQAMAASNSNHQTTDQTGAGSSPDIIKTEDRISNPIFDTGGNGPPSKPSGDGGQVNPGGVGPVGLPDNPVVRPTGGGNIPGVEVLDAEAGPLELVPTVQCGYDPDYPGDLLIANSGDEPLPAGTIVHWKWMPSGVEGTYVLEKDLPAKTARLVPDVIDHGKLISDNCSVKVDYP